MYKEGSENFAISKESYPMDFKRREILANMLDSASQEPNIIEKGLDTDQLNSEYASIGAKPPILTSEGNAFLTKFDPNTRYIPAMALEKHKGELRPELEAVKNYLPHLFASVKQLIKEAGVEGSVEPTRKIIIGVEKKQQAQESKVLGGFHSPLSEQGYKVLDGVVLITLENGTDNSVAYRIANVLRVLTHDSIHAIQYKLFAPHSWSTEDSEYSSAELDKQHKEHDTNMGYPRYGTAFFDVDKGVEDFKGRNLDAAFGIVLMEYITDKIARKLVKEYIASAGQSLPAPQTKFEELENKDFQAEAITEADFVGLKDYPDAQVAKNALEYSTEINEPAAYFFSLLGSYAQEAEDAVFEGSITGKFNKVLDLQKRIADNNYKTPEGQPLDIVEIKKFIKASVIVKAMFRDLK
jgi:hypothetical protein